MGIDVTPLKISFIIPYFNEAVGMLAECIDSIMALSLAPEEREIVVVDDGSTLSPINSLLSYGDNVIYVRKPNGGSSTARNMALGLATGNFVQFVDADDYLIPSVYDKCIDLVRQSNAEMVMFDFTRKHAANKNDSSFNCPARQITGPLMGAEYMRRHNLRGSAWGYLFKRALLHDLRFTKGLVYGEDEEFTPQLVLRCEQLYVFTGKAYFYRERNDSLTGGHDGEKGNRLLNDHESVITKLYYKAGTLPMAERLAMQRRVDQLTMDYLYNIMSITRSANDLEERIERLRKLGQFPLPHRHYTAKYTLFSTMANSRWGRRVLLAAIPLIRR